MLLQNVVEVSRRMSETRSRLLKTESLAGLLAELRGREIALGVAYLSGVVPQGKTGIGYAMVHGLRDASPAPAASIDLLELDQALSRLAQISGSGSTTERKRVLGELFSRATVDEQSFLSRLLVGELRQGALEGIMIEAIAKAAQVPASEVRRAAMFAGDMGAVAEAALEQGTPGLSRFHLKLFRPLQPMLAQPAHDVDEALATLGEMGLEYKLDGARIQVHREEDDVRIYSREGNDVTARLPEIVTLVRALPAKSFVLDGEALAMSAEKKPHPFQVTMRRFGRQQNVAALLESLPLTPFFFDALHVDGDDLVDLPSTERIERLNALLPEKARVPRLVTSVSDAAESFYAEALAKGHEGIMAKSLTASYAAGRRGAEWLKLKPAHTLDLVVLAAEWGSGRRQGWLSNLHLGARDEQGGYAMLGKTFKGMTDAMLTWQTEWLLAHEIGRDAMTVYVKPELVVEVAFDSVQTSPHYPSGMALRFARVKRYRDDKDVSGVDTVTTVKAILAREITAKRGARSETRT